jgi:DNA-directed RNA polymerase subunit K/omega
LKDNDEEMESQESSEEGAGEPDVEARASEDKVEEPKVKTGQFPANNYELAIVAAQEARRMNEGWKDEEGQPSGRVTDVALERVRKGEVRYKFDDGKGS